MMPVNHNFFEVGNHGIDRRILCGRYIYSLSFVISRLLTAELLPCSTIRPWTSRS